MRTPRRDKRPERALPLGYYASSTELNTLADIMATCINSGGGVANDLTPCGMFLAAAKPTGGVAPTDTVTAIVDILKNPTQNPGTLFNLNNAAAPFQPALTAAPSTWALPIVPAPATPTFSTAGGTYTTIQTVTLSDITSGAAIYYTLDGSTPTIASTLYSGSISVSASETINAIAILGGHAFSPVASAVYTVNLPVVAAPVFYVEGINGSFSGGTVSIPGPEYVNAAASTPASIVHCTTDGSTPTASSPVCGSYYVNGTAPILTLKAIGVLTGYQNSAVATITVTYTPPAYYALSMSGGCNTQNCPVNIQSPSAGATIYYTLDGSTPSTASKIYPGTYEGGPGLYIQPYPGFPITVKGLRHRAWI